MTFRTRIYPLPQRQGSKQNKAKGTDDLKSFRFIVSFLDPTTTFLARRRWVHRSRVTLPSSSCDKKMEPGITVFSESATPDPAYAPVCAEMKDRLFTWMMTRKLRVTLSDAGVEAATAGPKPSLTGWPIGVW